MVADGAPLGLLRTRVPYFFRPHGWAVCGRHSHWRAGVRDLLAELSAEPPPGGNPGAPPPEWAATRDQRLPLTIRPWRQVELPALMRLYSHWAESQSGPVARSEAYWRWLVASKAADQWFVAIEGPDRIDPQIGDGPIVGYCATREQRIAELVVAPGRWDAAARLLARACGDAIEKDAHEIALHGPPDHPLGELFLRARGTRHEHEVCQGEVFMARLFDPVEFLRGRRAALFALAQQARLPRPCELGLLLEGERLRLVVSRRSVKLLGGKLGRSYVTCNVADFTRMVLGHLDVRAAAGRLDASTRLAVEVAAALFPQRPLWRSPLDDLLC
jgi:hypothetical protein